MIHLVDELILSIFIHLCPRFVYTKLSLVCHRLYLLIKDESLWKDYHRIKFQRTYDRKNYTPQIFFKWCDMYDSKDKYDIATSIFESMKRIYENDKIPIIVGQKCYILNYIHEIGKLNPGKNIMIICKKYNHIRMELLIKKQHIFDVDYKLKDLKNSLVMKNDCTIHFYGLTQMKGINSKLIHNISKFILFDVNLRNIAYNDITKYLHPFNTAIFYEFDNNNDSKMFINSLFEGNSDDVIIIWNGKEVDKKEKITKIDGKDVSIRSELMNIGNGYKDVYIISNGDVCLITTK